MFKLEQLFQKVVQESCPSWSNFFKKLSKKVVQVWTTCLEVVHRSCSKKLFEKVVQTRISCSNSQKLFKKGWRHLTTSEHFYFDSRLNIATWPRKRILEQLFWTTFLNNFSLSKVVHKSCSNLNNFSKKLFKKVVWNTKSCFKKLFKKVVQNKKSCPTSCSRKLSEIEKAVQQVVRKSCPK